MLKYLMICLFWIGLGTGGRSQSMEFYNGSVDNAIALANLKAKPIFIMVFTDWCKPCARMTNETFTDKEVVNYMNRNFVNLKINAEINSRTRFIDELNISAYPTLLFLDSDGVLIIRKLGFMPAREFLLTSESAIKFSSDEQFRLKLSNFKTNRFDKSYVIELAQMAKDIDFNGKNEIVDSYFEFLTPGERNSNYDFFLSNIQYLSAEMMEVVVRNYDGPSGFFISTEERQNHARIDRKILSRIDELYDSAISLNDWNMLKLVTELNIKYMENNHKFSMDDQLQVRKKSDFYYLKFFENNVMKEEFVNLADRIIERYILSVKPAEMQKSDENSRNVEAHKREILFQTAPIPEEGVAKDLSDPFAARKMAYKNSYASSEKLDRISKKCLEFFHIQPDTLKTDDLTKEEEEIKEQAEDKYRRFLSKASYWSGMAYRYFPLARYFLTHAKLVLELGDNEMARRILMEGLTLGSSDESIMTEMKELLSSLPEEEID